MDATVSVILPIYNAERYLDQALHSVESQTCEDLQIICVNDGSTDASPSILRARAARDGRIRVIEQANAGYGAAMNAGLEATRGEWVAILEPDDWYEPDMIASLLTCAARYATPAVPIDIVKAPYWVIRDPDTPRQAKLNCSYNRRIRPAHQPFRIEDAPELLGHHPSIWSALYRTGFLRDQGIRFKEIPGAGWADNPFLVETLCQARAICYTPEAHYCYREEPPEKAQAAIMRSPTMPLERWLDMAKVLDRLGVTSPEVWREQTYRAFTYVKLSLGGQAWDAAPEQVRELAVRVFGRLDPALVFAEARVTTADKRLFAQVRGIDAPVLSEWPYRRRLMREALYNVRNRGLADTAKATARHLHP